MADGYSIPTGNEILSYTGNAGLAAGAGTGLMPIQVNPLSGVDSSLDKIQELHAHEKLIDYQKKIKDQEDLAKMLSETGGSVFNIKGASGQNASFQPLPDDQKILTEKAHDLRRIVLENPSNYQFNENYLDKRKELDNLTNHAGLRSQAYAGYNSDAAKANDPDERRSILNLRQAELDGHKLHEYHMPEPYLPAMQTVDPISGKDWTDKKKLQEFGTAMQTKKDQNGNPVDYQVKLLGIPNSELLAPLNDVSTKGTEYVKNSALGFYKLPQSRDPAFIQKMNADIDKKARQRGITPVYAATVDANGNVVYNPNPREIATALNIEKHGYTQTEEVPSDASIKQKKEAVDITNVRNEIKNRDAGTAQKWADLKEKIREWDNPHDKDKVNTESLKEQQYQKSAYNAYQDVHKVFDDAYSKQPTSMAVPSYWKEKGFDPNDYEFYPALDKKQADNFIGVPHEAISTTTGETGNKRTEKSTLPSATPNKVVPVVDKKTGERKLVYIGKKDESNFAVLAIVDEKNAIVNKLKHEANYDPKIYENQTVWVDKAYGGEAPAQQPQVAPAATVNKIDIKNPPANVSLKKGTKLGDVYIDKASRKAYSAITGEEIIKENAGQ